MFLLCLTFGVALIISGIFSTYIGMNYFSDNDGKLHIKISSSVLGITTVVVAAIVTLLGLFFLIAVFYV